MRNSFELVCTCFSLPTGFPRVTFFDGFPFEQTSVLYSHMSSTSVYIVVSYTPRVVTKGTVGSTQYQTPTPVTTSTTCNSVTRTLNTYVALPTMILVSLVT